MKMGLGPGLFVLAVYKVVYKKLQYKKVCPGLSAGILQQVFYAQFNQTAKRNYLYENHPRAFGRVVFSHAADVFYGLD
ncbi:hypothetical protein [Candidatus Avelusimicrobium faecicola]|uniref:hypothetical protein n=1 Tax=Candidatus Avelusimicrobium faecicola TaxID=3416205 RepID=UPI003D1026A8